MASRHGMIGFSEEHGGLLTEKQIDALVEGISAWAKDPPSEHCRPMVAPWKCRPGRNRFRDLLRELPWR
jgi:hypothetical protein